MHRCAGNQRLPERASSMGGDLNTWATGMLALLAVGASAGASAQVYELNFNVSAEHITGAITLGGETGTLSESDITAFSFSGTGPSTFALTGNSLFCNGGGGCGLSADGGTLRFDFASSSVFEDIFNCQSPQYCGFLSMNSAGVYGSGQGEITFDVNGEASGRWVAQAGLSDLSGSPSPAPEIDGGSASHLTLLVGLILVLHGRSPRRVVG